MQDALGHESGVGFSVARDVTAPVAWVRAPSAYVSGTFTVQWGAQDEGAGISGLYDVQYRIDDGAWVDWLTGTAATAAGFVGETGHVYYFRVRTWDRVGNERGYPAVADATTRIRAPVTKYYYANGRRVALRQGDVVYYLHSDHLGSTVVLSDGAGGEVPGSAVRYLPYGGLRLGEAGTLPTDYTFTGQRWEQGLGLYYYKARYYDPALGRFVSADTVVPQPGEPQGLNRYSYVYNNPLKYVDPTGHQPPPPGWMPGPPGLLPIDPGFWQTAMTLKVFSREMWNPPSSGVGLAAYWFFELGPSDTLELGLESPMTWHVMMDEGVAEARERFYQKGYQDPEDTGPYGIRGFGDFIRETGQFLKGEDTTTSALGRYMVYIIDNGDGTVTFKVYDKKGLESSTRNPLGVLLHTKSRHSIEGILSGEQTFIWPDDIVIESLLSDRPRGSVDGLMPVGFGGDLHIYFTWTETRWGESFHPLWR